MGLPGARLLLACRHSHWDPFHGAAKVVHVKLQPLSDAEAVELFLRLCHRPLLAADLLTPVEIQDHCSTENSIVSRELATRLLARCIWVFNGEPGLVRRAAAK